MMHTSVQVSFQAVSWASVNHQGVEEVSCLLRSGMDEISLEAHEPALRISNVRPVGDNTEAVSRWENTLP